MKPFATPRALIDYNTLLLHQLTALVAQHRPAQDGAFAAFLGPHVRHIIEHYEALTGPGVQSASDGNAIVNYDARKRDLLVQTEPRVALERIAALRLALQAMATWPDAAFDSPLEMHSQGGEMGELRFASRSTALRELAFLASHCVHHFAVIKLHAQQLGQDLGPYFGKAPATVAHETALREAAQAGS